MASAAAIQLRIDTSKMVNDVLQGVGDAQRVMDNNLLEIKFKANNKSINEALKLVQDEIEKKHIASKDVSLKLYNENELKALQEGLQKILDDKSLDTDQLKGAIQKAFQDAVSGGLLSSQEYMDKFGIKAKNLGAELRKNIGEIKPLNFEESDFDDIIDYFKKILQYQKIINESPTFKSQANPTQLSKSGKALIDQLDTMMANAFTNNEQATMTREYVNKFYNSLVDSYQQALNYIKNLKFQFGLDVDESMDDVDEQIKKSGRKAEIDVTPKFDSAEFVQAVEEQLKKDGVKVKVDVEANVVGTNNQNENMEKPNVDVNINPVVENSKEFANKIESTLKENNTTIGVDIIPNLENPQIFGDSITNILKDNNVQASINIKPTIENPQEAADGVVKQITSAIEQQDELQDEINQSYSAYLDLTEKMSQYADAQNKVNVHEVMGAIPNLDKRVSKKQAVDALEKLKDSNDMLGGIDAEKVLARYVHQLGDATKAQQFFGDENKKIYDDIVKKVRDAELQQYEYIEAVNKLKEAQKEFVSALKKNYLKDIDKKDIAKFIDRIDFGQYLDGNANSGTLYPARFFDKIKEAFDVDIRGTVDEIRQSLLDSRNSDGQGGSLGIPINILPQIDSNTFVQKIQDDINALPEDQSSVVVNARVNILGTNQDANNENNPIPVDVEPKLPDDWDSSAFIEDFKNKLGDISNIGETLVNAISEALAEKEFPIKIAPDVDMGYQKSFNSLVNLTTKNLYGQFKFGDSNVKKQLDGMVKELVAAAVHGNEDIVNNTLSRISELIKTKNKGINVARTQEAKEAYAHEEEIREMLGDVKFWVPKRQTDTHKTTIRDIEPSVENVLKKYGIITTVKQRAHTSDKAESDILSRVPELLQYREGESEASLINAIGFFLDNLEKAKAQAKEGIKYSSEGEMVQDISNVLNATIDSINERIAENPSQFNPEAMNGIDALTDKFNALREVLDSISELYNVIFGGPKNMAIDFGALSKMDLDFAQQFSINADLIKQGIVTILSAFNWETGIDTNILNTIDSITSKSKELEKFAQILKASKDKISEAGKAMNVANEQTGSSFSETPFDDFDDSADAFINKQENIQEAVEETKEAISALPSVVEQASDAMSHNNSVDTNTSLLAVNGQQLEQNTETIKDNVQARNELIEATIETEKVSGDVVDDIKKEKDAYDDMADSMRQFNEQRKKQNDTYDSETGTFDSGEEQIKHSFEDFYGKKGFQYKSATFGIDTSEGGFDIVTAQVKYFNKELQQTITDIWTLNEETGQLDRKFVRAVDDGEKRAKNIQKEITQIENEEKKLTTFLTGIDSKTQRSLQGTDAFKTLAQYSSRYAEGGVAEPINDEALKKIEIAKEELKAMIALVEGEGRRGTKGLNVFSNIVEYLKDADHTFKLTDINYQNLIEKNDTLTEAYNRLVAAHDEVVRQRDAETPSIAAQAKAIGDYREAYNEVNNLIEEQIRINNSRDAKIQENIATKAYDVDIDKIESRYKAIGIVVEKEVNNELTSYGKLIDARDKLYQAKTTDERVSAEKAFQEQLKLTQNELKISENQYKESITADALQKRVDTITNSYKRQFKGFEGAGKFFDEIAKSINIEEIREKLRNGEISFKDFSDSVKNTFEEAARNSANWGKIIKGNIINTVAPNDFENARVVMENYLKSMGKIRKELSYSDTDKNGFFNATAEVELAGGKIEKVAFAYENATGRIIASNKHMKTELTGFSKIFDTLGREWEKLVARWSAQLLTPQSFLRYFRQGIQVIQQYDDAMVEMRKVSNDTEMALQSFAKSSFSIANQVGTTGLQMQKSAVDFMRLGESIEEAAKHAQEANILMNVSEFSDINEATDAFIQMTKAYKELDSLDVVNKLNVVGVCLNTQ